MVHKAVASPRGLAEARARDGDLLPSILRRGLGPAQPEPLPLRAQRGPEPQTRRALGRKHEQSPAEGPGRTVSWSRLYHTRGGQNTARVSE